MNYFISIFFVASVLVSALHAEPDIVDLKDTSSILKAEYQDLSPAYGCLWYKEPILYNMYRLRLLENDPVNALVKRLFFLNNDMINFNPQHNQQRLEAHLTPEIIGSIIGYIRKHNDLLAQQIATKLDSDVDDIVKKVSEKQDADREKIKTSKLNQYKNKSNADLTKNLITLFSSHIKLSQTFKAGLQGAIDTIQKKIDDLQLSKDPANDDQIQLLNETKTTLENRIRGSQWPKSYLGFCTDFVNAITKAREVCDNQDYLDITLSNILLGFAWAKSMSKQDLQSYFMGLNSVLGNDAFTDVSFKNDASKWLSTCFTQVDFNVFQNQFNDDPITLINKPEEAVYFYYNFRLGSFPEKIRYLSSINYSGKTFPDCGEILVLNLFNLIAYDAKTASFSADRLKKIGVTDEKLLNFYMKFSKPVSHQSTTAHNAFAIVVSKLPNIHYRHSENYEITALGDGKKGFENFNTIIKYFTGQPTLQKLFELVKTSLGLDTDFQNPVIDKNAKTVSIPMKIQNYGYAWKFYPGHFDLDITSSTLVWPSPATLPFLKKNNSTLIWNCLIGGALDITDPKAFIYLHCVCKKLQDISISNNTLKAMSTINNLAHFSVFISDLYFYYPSQDTPAQKSFFEIIPSKNRPDVIHKIISFKNLTGMQQENLVKTIINYKITDGFEKYITSALSTINSDSDKTSIIRDIINKNLGEKLADSITAALPTINGDLNKKIIIQTIIDRNLAEKFADWIISLLLTIQYIPNKIFVIQTLIDKNLAEKFADPIRTTLDTMKNTAKATELTEKLNKALEK